MISIKSEKDFDFIKKELRNGADEKELTSKLKSRLSQSQKEQLSKILNDKAVLKKLLDSEKAKSILDSLTGDKNGQHK